ncbi:hypothetical protein [Luteibacter sahnii]|uniref:hypothetical protein n=1 Tax=Luteibacter sahnii TaxID=3021977 RepID=UPI002A747EB9|nr:hypothetical protein [Luteibacter sp. PPL193]MDY1550148.1 hypothetical protein [Luteibacter sp. PPL193]
MQISPMRESHLIKAALAIAIIAIDRRPGPLQPVSDMHDMKLLLEDVTSEAELSHYSRAAWTALFGKVPPNG